MTTTSVVITEGNSSFHVINHETFSTHYRIFGDIKSTDQRPLVLLHGGPGFTSSYLEPFRLLSSQYGIPVVMYDQLGCGESSHVKDTSPEFWSMDLFMDELEALLKHLNIYDNFDLLGHSWGGMLAIWYAGTRQPNGLKNLILANTLASMPQSVASYLELVKQLPPDVQDVINDSELNGKTDTPEYEAALNVFMKNFICRVDPFPDSLMKCFEEMEKDSTVADAMFGPAFIRCLGTLEDWSAVHLLPRINARTLVYSGALEDPEDTVTGTIFHNIKKVKWVRFENCSHMTHYEATDRCLELIANLVKEAV